MNLDPYFTPHTKLNSKHLTTGYSDYGMNLDPYFTPYTKINSKTLM
jgi:hypothetical protein